MVEIDGMMYRYICKYLYGLHVVIKSVEIPDEEKQPQLYQIVKSCMIHGPCGIHNPQSVCMENGTCTKGYPGEFNDETKLSFNGYFQY